MNDVRLLIVASDPLARAGLATLLGGQPGCEIVGQVDGAEILSAGLDVWRPDVLIWDLGWDAEESLEILVELVADIEVGTSGIVALLPDEELAAEAWSAGARGLLTREADPEQLLAAAQAVKGGLATVDPLLMDTLLPPGLFEEPPADEALTPRELEVLQLLAEGLANRAIAQRLGISEHTVKFHVNAIMGKLGAQSRTAAVVRATRLGLILL
jgi:DNA-binding NarL/FixJ family response regulator